jgi:two-component system response regulator DesR
VIRILLADDQALVRGALAALLDLEADIEVVAQVGRGDEAVTAARESGAEVCLLDIEMPGSPGSRPRRLSGQSYRQCGR